MNNSIRLTVNNQSETTTTFCLYQQAPEDDYRTLAWQTRKAAPTTEVVFQWEPVYDFVWRKTSSGNPQAITEAHQVWPADLMGQNSVEFTQEGGVYTFANPSRSPESGSLLIKESASVIPGDALVGIGMAGIPFLMVPCQPNLQLTLTPKPEYWLVSGNFESGQVIGVSEISNACKLEFGLQQALHVTLNPDNSWTVTPG